MAGMMNGINGRFTAALVALLVMSTTAHAQAPSSAEGGRAEMTRFKPSAEEVLTPPKGIQGDFTIARVPPVIDFAVLPGQWKGAKLWSNWGDAVHAVDGNFYGSIGDHDDPYGTSYVYQVNPRTRQIKLVVDYNRHVGVKQGMYAPGKIHGPLMEGKDGWLYMIGYPGGVGTTETYGYKGDWMLRYNVHSGEVQNLGVPVPYSSVPSSAILGSGKVMYGLNTPGLARAAPERQFFAYDLDKREMIFFGGPAPSVSRAFMLAEDGRAWYTADGVVVRYDPTARRITRTNLRLPGMSEEQMNAAKTAAKLKSQGKKFTPPENLPTGGVLRAASRPDKNGIVYGITKDGHVFSFDTRSERVTPITKAFVEENTASEERGGQVPLYTAVVRLSENGHYLYYIPSAHGGSRLHGTGVVQLDVRTGKRKVLAFLNDYIQKRTGYSLGGTFGLELNEDESQLFITWNGSGDPKSMDWPDFGLTSVMILHIPESER